ncbi:MAG: hypothetical protein ACNA7K_02620 [Acholeplasmataceae bacterium]
MKALFIVLNQESYLEDILLAFVELGVKGGTIVDSKGMAGAMIQVEKRVSFFGALKNAFETAQPFNKTIFTVIDNDQLLERVVSRIHLMFADIKGPGFGFMFAVPVDGVWPLGKHK